MHSTAPSKLNPSRPSRAPAPQPAVTVKGFYLRALLRELANNGHHLAVDTNYREFGDYPVSVAHELLRETGRRLYPSETRAEGLRRIGWIIYPTLLSTMVGKVIFASVGHDLREVLRIAGRGFQVSISSSRYDVLHIGQRDAQVSIRDFPLYPDSFLVGVFEGVLTHYGYDEGKVEARVLSTTDADLSLSW